jgi:hypothetical protein
MKRRLVATATFVFGLFYLLEYVIPARWQSVRIGGHDVALLTHVQGPLADFLIVVMVFSLGLGWANLMGSQWRKLRTGLEGGRAPAGFFFVSTFATLLLGFWYMEIERRHGGTASLGPHGHMAWLGNTWVIVRDQVNGSLIASVFSLLAAYRAFKVRNLDATLMMISAMIVMMGNVPIGNAITHPLRDLYGGVFQFPTWAIWLMNNVNTPASRAMGFGIAIGVIAISLRLWLSLERGAFFEREL